MHSPLAYLALLLPVVSAVPAPNPLALLNARAGPAAGSVITSCTQPNTIALTFDDGPYQYEGAIVQALNAAGAKGTFFVTGTLYNCIYSQASQLKATYAAGHQIASHTWTHADLSTKSAADVKTEMTKLETAFANILGVKPTYMRPPNGNTGGQMKSVMQQLGYRIVTWDIDSEDWNHQTPQYSEQKFSSTGAGSHIPLMHETIPTTSQTLLPWVLNWAKQKGLKMVTVAECLGDAGGAYTTPVATTGATNC
ncbi:Glycoside hydrolase [Venustampulla echinocandica]|uniref:Glycoside hydrolase n=1 Tax=Venustampulla echinocandica TaxID=2656787 RepID=A0A370T918_9HELO|nr:Glycoside hydrolase [Venustampulla echinocandica]RDL29984.1 Glycoside hydrolase [Venustampulla echinocandica]